MSMSDHGIYTWKILLGTYQGHRVRALQKGVLEPLRKGTYITYPYRDFHKYRVLVLQLAGNHPIPVTHRFHVFPSGVISPDC
jgi:hypothetical protein